MLTTTRGREAEQAACDYLQQHGLRLIERNYRCPPGEIDLIMESGNCMVFVEVRYRNNALFGSAAESVDRRKQRKLIAAAKHYLQRYKQRAKQPARFDIIAIDSGDIEWIENAFDAG